MSNEHRALKLADDLETEFTQGRITNHSGRNAAAELRRQHALIVQMVEHADHG